MNHVGDVGAGHVLGRYELLMPIASGGMATVWAARLRGSRGFQKTVAVKTILPQLVDDPRFDQMFLDEASLAAGIRHPHVVEILDLGEQNGVLYLVMEWVDGEPLSVVLKASSKAGGMPLPIAIRIASQACAGLHAAHELRDESGNLVGLVHRDVSPQNILITYDGVVKVVDFGVAKATGRVSGQTSAGQIKGKAAYMSPEQARGGEIDRRTDIFALGILLFLMTTGHHPFRGENDFATLNSICSPERSPSPRAFVPDYPRPLELIVAKALAKDPKDRYATASDLLRALDHALPASMRVVTDDVVAEFMNRLLHERQTQRHESLKSAQRTADERASGRAPLQSLYPLDRLSPSGFTPLSQSGLALPPGNSVSGPRTAVASPQPEPLASSPSAATSAVSSASIPQQGDPRRARWIPVSIGTVALIAAAGFGALAASNSSGLVASFFRLGGPTRGAASTPAAVGQAPPGPSGSQLAPQRGPGVSGSTTGRGPSTGVAAGAIAIGEAPTGDDLVIDPGDDAGPSSLAQRTKLAPKGPGAPRPGPKPTEPGPGAGKTPSPTSTTFLSPVRNPGF